MSRLRIKPPIDRDHLMPRIRDLDRQGVSQTSIAVEIGVSPSTVQKWLWAERSDEDGDRRRARRRR